MEQLKNPNLWVPALLFSLATGGGLSIAGLNSNDALNQRIKTLEVQVESIWKQKVSRDYVRAEIAEKCTGD